MSSPGKKIHVVAVHGNGGGAFRFSLLRRSLSDRVVLHPITLPGFEGTQLVENPTIRTFSTAIANEIHALRGRVGDDSIVLLGHGIGGSIGLDLLARDPNIVDGAILHALVGAHLDERWFPRLMQTRPVRRVIQLTISSWLAQTIGSRVLFGGKQPAYARRFLAEYRRCDAFSPMFDVLTAEWFDALPVISTPTALLWGENDRVLNHTHIAEFEAKLASVRTTIQPDWGHFPMVDLATDYGTVIARLATELIDDAPQ